MLHGPLLACWLKGLFPRMVIGGFAVDDRRWHGGVQACVGTGELWAGWGCAPAGGWRAGSGLSGHVIGRCPNRHVPQGSQDLLRSLVFEDVGLLAQPGVQFRNGDSVDRAADACQVFYQVGKVRDVRGVPPVGVEEPLNSFHSVLHGYDRPLRPAPLCNTLRHTLSRGSS